MRTRMIAGPWLLVVALAAGAAGCTREDPKPYVDGGTAGAFPVGHMSLMLTGPAARPIAVDLFYPADAARITAGSAPAVYLMDPVLSQVPPTTSTEWETLGYDKAYEEPAAAAGARPLVMFSAGGSQGGWGYLYLGTRLASHGYLVAVVAHAEEAQWMATPWGGIQSAFHSRPLDVSAALDDLLARNATAGGPLSGRIDPARVVAAGHSLGGYTAWTLLAGDDDVCDPAFFRDGLTPEQLAAWCTATAADPRFSAIFTLDGSSWGMRFAGLARISEPSLVMGQAAYADGLTDPAYPDDFTTVARPHAAMGAGGHAVRVDVALGDPAPFINHMAFSNAWDGMELAYAAGGLSADDHAFYAGFLGGSTLPTREIHGEITRYVLAFLDSQVQADAEAGAAKVLTQAEVAAGGPGLELWWTEGCGAATDTTFPYATAMQAGACAVGDKDPVAYFP